MLINAEGWIQHPDFIRIDGIADKVYSQANTGEGGLACHSIVGEEPDHEDGVPNRFLSLERGQAVWRPVAPDCRDAGRASRIVKAGDPRAMVAIVPRFTSADAGNLAG